MAVDPVSPGEGQRLAKHNTNDIEAHSQSSESAEGRDIDDGKYVDSAAVSPDEAFAEDYEGGDGWETRSLPEPGSTLQTSTPEIKSPSASELAYDQWCERNIASLLEACCNRDPAKAIRILEQAYERQVAHKMTGLRDDFSETALHVASGHGEIEVVKQLLAKGADVNAVNNLGCTPLNRAVVAGSIKVVEILLDAGANLEHQDDISGTPLHGAARRNLSQCCRVLLNRGALVDAYDGVGNTPLHLAAAEGAISTVRVLVKHNADPHVPNIRGRTPLDVAQASWIGLHCKEKIAAIMRSESG